MFRNPLHLTALLASLLAVPCAIAAEAPQPAVAQAASTVTMQTSDGVTLHASTAGQGIPCLFIHGGPGSGSESIERLAGATLERNFRMIYLDQRGSGRSGSDPAKNYSLDRVLQDIEEVRAKLQIKQWVVMSHSFGGIIASAYAAKYPERVRGMVLTNSILNLPASMESTAAYGYSLLPKESRPPMDPAAPLPQRFGMVMSLLNQQKLASQLMYANAATDARVNASMAGLAANRDFATSLFQSGAIMGYLNDYAPATASMAFPVLVISGKDDQVVGVEHYKTFRFPHQQVVMVPGKHFALIENAAEVDQALAGFSTRLAAAEAPR